MKGYKTTALDVWDRRPERYGLWIPVRGDQGRCLGAAVDPAAISDKALAVGGGVLQALGRLGIPPASAS